MSDDEVEVARPLDAEEARSLPVFPLPNAVLLPGTLMALHLFEPRYRALARCCLEEGPRAIAMAILLPGYEADYHGRPAFRRLGGAGRIVAHRAQPDGTFDLLLAGVGRIEMDEIVDPAQPFRRARVTLVEDPPPTPTSEDEIRRLVRLASTIPVPPRLVPIPPPPLEGSPGERLDLLCDRYFPAVFAVRHAVLEARTLTERARVLEAALADRVLTSRPPRGAMN